MLLFILKFSFFGLFGQIYSVLDSNSLVATDWQTSNAIYCILGSTILGMSIVLLLNSNSFSFY